MPRVDSATGLSSLRMAEGAMPRNTSVEDFLSLVAYGDISAPDHDVLNKSLSLFSQHHHLAAQAAERGARGAGGGAGSFQPAVFSGNKPTKSKETNPVSYFSYQHVRTLGSCPNFYCE